MSIYEVRFIKQANDSPEKHIVIEVEASTPDEAEETAREKMKTEQKSLAAYPFFSREIKRY